MLLLLASMATGSPACTGPQTSSQLAAALWGPGSGYDKDTRPTVAMAARAGNFTRQPADTVFMQLQPFAITEVLPRLGQVNGEFWVRAIWWDPRLRYNSTCFKPPESSGSYEVYGYHESFDPDQWRHLWKPSIVTTNLRDEEDVLAEQFWVEASGRVWHTKKVIWKIGCDMVFAKLPFDVARNLRFN